MKNCRYLLAPSKQYIFVDWVFSERSDNWLYPLWRSRLNSPQTSLRPLNLDFQTSDPDRWLLRFTSKRPDARTLFKFYKTRDLPKFVSRACRWGWSFRLGRNSDTQFGNEVKNGSFPFPFQLALSRDKNFGLSAEVLTFFNLERVF